MALDRDMIAPSTSWACLRERAINVGYGPVCKAIGDVTGEAAIGAAVYAALKEKADTMSRLPDMIGLFEVPTEVVSRACRRVSQIADMLRALSEET